LFHAVAHRCGGRLLGTVDVSVQEMTLPTHAVAGGLYLSHMAVAERARRRGIGRELLRAARECAARRGEDCLYLHVEPANDAAIGLYESAGYVKLADVAPYASFTRALKLQERAVLYRQRL
jgi:ribosomal protein S18 acetylase RimI-like enzyme